MSSSALAAGMRHLRYRLAAQQSSEASDEQLLHAFLSRRDESAFAILVRRHGPMVLHVCRRVLGHEQDAEDAFQATFLVLAQSAAALRSKTMLASFLHGTAYRTAMKAKQSAARRRKHEGQATARSSANPADELSWREVQVLLDEEIARLPEIYRGVFVLCSLEGLSREEAAQRLGVKEGTVSSRLTTARKRLAKELARHGVELATVLTITGLATQSASALPAVLMATTIKAALAAAAGEKLAGIVSASVAQLVKSATIALAVNKAKIATILLVTATLLTGASVCAYRGLAANATTPSALPAGKTDDQPQAISPKHEEKKTLEIQGRVLDPDGKPKAGVKLLMLEDGGNSRQLGTTAADGRFTVNVPKGAKIDYLIAQADGFGLDFLQISKSDLKKPVELRLVKDQPIRGRVVNTEGKPIAGVRVAVNSFNVYANNSLDSFLVLWKKRNHMSGVPGGEKHLWLDAAGLLPATTGADGRFALHGIGVERFVSLRLSGAGMAEVEQWIANRAGFDPKPYNKAMLDNEPKGFERAANRWLLQGPDVSIVAEAEKPIRGMVKDADSGKGCPGVLVRLTRINNSDLVAPIAQAKTDAQGRYEIHGARKVRRYMLEIAADTTTGHMPCQVWTDDTPGYQPITADIQVKKGVIIAGKIIDGATGKPVRGFAMADVLSNNPFAKNYPPFNNSAWFGMRQTDDGGAFRVVVTPGPVVLMGGPRDVKTRLQFKPPAPDPKYPQYFGARIPNFPEYHGYGGTTPIQGNYCKVLEIKPDALVVQQDIVLERASVLPVQVQDADGKPLSGVWAAGLNPEDWHYPVRCETAECSVYQLEPGKERLVVFFDPARKLVGTLALKGDEKSSVTAKLGQVGAIKGRLLDSEDKRLAGVVVDVHYRQRVADEIHKRANQARQIVTDAQGTFTLDDLIPGQKFELSFRRGKHQFERTPKLVQRTIEVKPGECSDLGTIKLKRNAETAGE